MTGVKEAGGRPAVHQTNPQTAVQFSKGPHPPLQASIHSASIPLLLPPPRPPSIQTYRFYHWAPAIAVFDRVPAAGQRDTAGSLTACLTFHSVGSTVVTLMTTINNVTEA